MPPAPQAATAASGAAPPPLPPWVHRVLALRVQGHRSGLRAAYLGALAVFVADYLKGPALVLTILYLPPLLGVAVLSRTWWHGYGCALGLTILVYLADRFAPFDAAGALPLPPCGTWPPMP